MKKKEKKLYLTAAKELTKNCKNDLEQNVAAYVHGIGQMRAMGDNHPEIKRKLRKTEKEFIEDTKEIMGRMYMMFGYANKTYPRPAVNRILKSGPAVIVFWNDGTKTVAVCSEEDDYSYETGLFMAVLKKIAPKEMKEAIALVKILRNITPQEPVERGPKERERVPVILPKEEEEDDMERDI